MKKNGVLLILFVILCSCAIACAVVLSEKKTEDTIETKTMPQYTNINLSFDKAEEDRYDCVVSNNSKNYIMVKSGDEGSAFWLSVDSKKPTPKEEQPVITVYKLGENNKKTVYKEYRITVEAVSELDFDDVKINLKASKLIRLDTPYYLKEYAFDYDKSVASIEWDMGYGSDCVDYRVTGLKDGETTVKVTLDGTDKQVGSFTITVGDFDASVKDGFKNTAIYYNEHTESVSLDNCAGVIGYFDLAEAIDNYRADAIYSVSADDEKLIKITETEADEQTPAAVRVASAGTGKTTLTVYETVGKQKTAIGTIELEIKRAADKDVAESVMCLDNDGLFYESFISPDDRYDLKTVIAERYLKSSFDDGEYTISVKASPSEVLTVDENGVITCHSVGINEVSYTVTFEDGSKLEGSGSLDTVDEEH